METQTPKSAFSHPLSKLLKMQMPGPLFRTVRPTLVGFGERERKGNEMGAERWRSGVMGRAEQESAFFKLMNCIFLDQF